MGFVKWSTNVPVFCFVFLWSILAINSQVNCPPNADYRQGAGCYCRGGYIRNALGTGCEDLNECATGEHQCLGAAFCVNMEATYRCDCLQGFELYQVPTGFQCRDINECTLNPSIPVCGSKQKCENSPSSYRCTCKEGYSQLHSGAPCTDIDECMFNSWACHPKAKCGNTVGGYNCTCAPGYRGDGQDCQDFNECDRPNICGTNARCINTMGSHKCECLTLSGIQVGVKDGEDCAGGAEQQLLADHGTASKIGIGVGVAMAILALIVAIIIVVVVVKRRKPPSKTIPGFSFSDGVEITPIGIDLPQYENVPVRTDANYITVISDPDDPVIRSGTPGNNFNDLYSNNKIIKSKNIYNANGSSLDRRIPKIALMPQNVGIHKGRVRGTSYEGYSNQSTVVTPGVRPSDYDTYNMLWEKINKDIETIKPSLRSQGGKGVELSRRVSSNSNYDHLGRKSEGVRPPSPIQDYNHVYDTSGKTSF